MRARGPLSLARMEVLPLLADIADNPSGAIGSLQDLGNGILNGDGGDVGSAIGGLLDGLLGKPQGGSPPPRRSRHRDDQQDQPR